MPGEPEGGPTEAMPLTPSNPPGGVEARPLSPDLVQQFLNNQARELDIREKETALEHLKQQNAYSYSENALEKQSAFYMQEGKLRHNRFNSVMWMVVFVTLIVAIFLGTLGLTGHEKLAEELLKDVVLLFGGGAGGYGIANRKNAQSQQQQPAPPPNAGQE